MKSGIQARRLLWPAAMLVLAAPVLAQTPPPWQVNLQAIADYTPLEVKMTYSGGYDSGSISLAALYNNGSENVVDLYSLSASESGITVEDHWPGVASGQVFGLGQPCAFDAGVAFPLIEDFDVHAIRRDAMGVSVVAIDTGGDNHTNTDCVALNGSLWVAAQNFDSGVMDYYRSGDDGLGWMSEFSYQPDGGAIIGPFSGGFRPATGGFTLGGERYLGTTYQRQSGELEAVALALDGSPWGPVGFDGFADHGSFIGNGHLKECAGLVVDSWPFGICNGGTAVGLGKISPMSGEPGFRLLNSVNAGSHLGFQGVSLSGQASGDDYHLHAFSSRHVRRTYNSTTGEVALEAIPDYAFADIGGPVASLYGLDRLFVVAAGFADDGGGEPSLMMATLDPALIAGEPLDAPDDGDGGETAAFPVPAAGPFVLAALALVLALFGLAGLSRRT